MELYLKISYQNDFVFLKCMVLMYMLEFCILNFFIENHLFAIWKNRFVLLWMLQF